MLSTKLRAASLAALVAFLGCNTSDVPASSTDATSAPSPGATGTPRQFAVAHSNDSVGAPSFVWLMRSDWPEFASAQVAAAEILRAVAPTFHLGDTTVATLGEAVLHDTGSGAIIAKFAQRIDGIDVFRGGLNIAMSRKLEPVSASGLVAASINEDRKAFTLDAIAALDIAHQTLTGTSTTFSQLDLQHDYERFTSASRSLPLSQPARAKRVYFPKLGAVEPGWYTELLLASGVSHSYVVSAVTGKILFSNDLVRYDAYTYRVWASSSTLLPMDGPQGNDAVPLVVPSRNGFKPTFAPQELVTLQNFPFSKNDPWLPPGAVTTSGNNVQAYSDVVAPDGFTANSADRRGAISSASTFDYAYDTLTTSAGTTPEATQASITQMFYVTNFLHDWYYDSGFDEKSGNHQQDNFGRGGVAKDPLHAETQDYSGRNNANASTPPDGASPRIQMYLFGGGSKASLDVDAPAPNAGTKVANTSGQFGKDSFALSGAVRLAPDGSAADGADACVAIKTAVLTGKIALVHRGNCAFVVKAQNVQTAGAIGIIVANVPTSAQPATAPFMGGTAIGVTIPAVSLSLADGQALEAALAAGVTVTMKREPSKDLDGAFDDQIVSHEWGHVLSNRLVSDGSGLDTNMAGGLGEGWADFSAQLITVRPDDALVAANANWNGVYPSATYATGGDSEFYYGIRRVPYSTDLTKDPLTFIHISNGVPLPNTAPISFGEDGSSNSEVHNTGEVWATMLWECYAALLRDPRFTFKEAQDRMKRYLVASLKLTPPSPTLLEARDAVIAAAYANDPKDFDLFWKAFAKRGAGVGAVAPDRKAGDNVGVTESFVVGNAVSLVASSLKDDVITCDHDGILDECEVGTIELTVRNSGAGTLNDAIAKLTSKSASVTFAKGGEVKFDQFKPFEQRTVKVKASIEGAASREPLLVDIVVSDPSLVKDGTLKLQLPARHQVDEAADSATTDTVETTGTSWAVSGEDQTGTSVKWHRIQTGTNASWFVPNANESADHKLTSAAFQVADSSFTLSFKHRWSFESSVKEMKDFDGGVVEITTDNGKTWQDISVYGKIDYNVTLENDPATVMTLKGRKAFGHDSPGYPDAWVTTTVNVTLKDPQATVKIRFRAGSDDNSAAVGWEIDDIAVTDLTNQPFWSFVPQRDLCDPKGPTATAPEGKKVGSKAHVTLTGTATHPKNLPLNYTWRQTGGPPVVLANRADAVLVFDAPETTNADIHLVFALRAHDGALLSAPSTVEVLVSPNAAAGGATADSGCGCRVVSKTSGSSRVLWAAGLAGFALLVRRRRRARLH